ncbi:MAG: DNA damage-inducible protein D [Rubrivivax sp.]|jgi:DNA-damage-inducible protein D|nr:DNA damage-inducible protein D [Rubrivivax sp.]
MKREVIVKLLATFEELVQHDDEGGEFWLARDLQELLGYARWENFAKVIEKARVASAGAGHSPDDHFLDVTKMVDLGSGATRAIDDVALTRYACYLIAQNGDSSKDAIAFAQTYFAVQTRKQELIEQRIAEVERLSARKKLTLSEKELSGIIYERVGDQMSFARIRSKGDVALFGGLTTQDMKNRLGVPDSRPLADFLPTITIKAKDFANEITNFNIKRDGLADEPAISHEHVKNNRGVRELLGKRGIRPESLPAAEDIKRVERRVQAETKKLPAPKRKPRKP